MKCALCLTDITNDIKYLLSMCLLRNYIIKICDDCKNAFEKVDPVRCLYCGNQQNKIACLQCVELERKVKHVAMYNYNDVMKEYIKAFKFSGGFHLKGVFQNEIKRQLKQLGNPIVVPIPVGQDAYLGRGFDHIAALLENQKIHPLLTCQDIRKKHQKELNRQERLKSEQPFKINSDITFPKLDNKICVFDDIYTTGQTISHAVQILQRQGFSNIMSLSLIR